MNYWEFSQSFIIGKYIMKETCNSDVEIFEIPSDMEKFMSI